MANHYLPLLLVSVNAAVAPNDDSSLGATMPRGQVDYLSHRWREEDVWRSWRDMTRRKNEITNGARLENASWRTWWKQRNKLKTISPETLNWLKDSDVTWLYGPYHTAIDWAPPPKPKADPCGVDKEREAGEHLGLIQSSHITRSPVIATKPILKHRSVSELLGSPGPPSPPVDDEEYDEAEEAAFVATRPALPHTKSDSHILRWRRTQAFRKDSPPRMQPPGALKVEVSTVPDDPSSSSNSDRDSAGASVPPSSSRRKHISFNTFVEQCISIDTHPITEVKSRTASMNGRGSRLYTTPYSSIDDEGVFEEESESASGSGSESEDDDEDDAIEFRSRSRSNSSTILTGAPAPLLTPMRRPTMARSLSNDKDTPITIAPIAPTMLKTTDEDIHQVTDQSPLGAGTLVYVPLSRAGSTYSLLSDRSRSDSMEDVHVHREARFAIGGGLQSPSILGYTPGSNRFVPGLVAASPSPIRLPGTPARSPLRNDDSEDYFVGTDIGAEHSRPSSSYGVPRRRKSSRDLASTEEEPSVQGSSLVRTPSLVVGEGTEAMMEHTSANQAASAPVPVPGRVTNSRLLSPPEMSSSPGSPRGRGRSRSRSGSMAGSVPGSVDSIAGGSSGEREREGRGRSQVRTPGGDRSRSGSRAPVNGGSPLGSLSPSSSIIGVTSAAAAYVGGRERGREVRPRARTGSSDSLNAPNARGRGPRRMGDSLSPPSATSASMSSPSVAIGPARTLGPLPEEAGPSSPTLNLNLNASSTASSSATITPTSKDVLSPSVSRAPPPPRLAMPPPPTVASVGAIAGGAGGSSGHEEKPHSAHLRSQSASHSGSHTHSGMMSPKSIRRLSGGMQSPGLLQVPPPVVAAPRETVSVSPPSASPSGAPEPVQAASSANVNVNANYNINANATPISHSNTTMSAGPTSIPGSKPADVSVRIRGSPTSPISQASKTSRASRASEGSSSMSPPPNGRARERDGNGNGTISGRATEIVQNTRSFLSSLWNTA